jgi:hypothetical protein
VIIPAKTANPTINQATHVSIPVFASVSLSATGVSTGALVSLADVEGAGVGDEVGVAQGIDVKVSLMRVTDPLRASVRPWIVTLSLTLIEVNARIVPANVEPVSNVAELGTSQ